MKRKIAILIRVYDRVEDLKYNLQVIRKTWIAFDYHIIVVSNGYPKGYEIDSDSVSLIDDLVVLEHNAGHRRGNSQLLLEGRKRIPEGCDYTLILEADTWVYTDKLIGKYVRLMDAKSDIVWASADWYDKDYALALDIALIKTKFIQENEGVFDFEVYPESHIANFLHSVGAKFMWITENMPVHVPSYIPKYPYINDPSQKRFYVFPKTPMVTHHIEFVKGGMEQKKRYFNIIANTDFFADQPTSNKGWERFKMRFYIALSKCFIRKSWFQKKYYREIPQQ